MKENLINKKIAIVYDWFDKWGGVERILLVLKELFPQAIFFTSYLDKEKAIWSKDFKIQTSFLEKFPLIIKKNRILSLPFYPIVFESFNFDAFDLVISITSSFAKGVITKPKTFHLCYLLTPTRFLWVMPENYQITSFKKKIFYPYWQYLKKWDLIAGQRPDKIISISKTVAERCLKYYQRRSEIIYPPFDIDYWEKIKKDIFTGKKIENAIKEIIQKKYFLIVSRLEPYKKIDLAIKAFKRLKKDNKQFKDHFLIIVGEGSQKNNLKQLVDENILILSYISDYQLAYLYYYALALIMPQEEDFGYTSLEAQYFECPVIAYNKGGARETILENKTGIFFDKQEEKVLKEALERFHIISYNLKKEIKRYAQKNIDFFDKKLFEKKFLKIIKNEL